jgi:hypothetical protein
MGWHDATVWAVAFLATDPRETLDSSGELALDIDYIVQWIEPVPPDEYFTFTVAPATLVFNDVWGAEAVIASGFHQYFRSRPSETGNRQRLTIDERSGLSFARPTSF